MKKGAENTAYTAAGATNNLSYAGLEMARSVHRCSVEGGRKASYDLQVHRLFSPCSASSPLPVSIYFPSLIWHSRNGDLEPWRCRRTDDKKWRCSKDVAVQQKYCERHLHRGRARS